MAVYIRIFIMVSNADGIVVISRSRKYVAGAFKAQDTKVRKLKLTINENKTKFL